MTIQKPRVVNIQRPVVQQSSQTGLPQMDEHYFEKLAAFGLACLAAAIVGKLVMTALTPRQPGTKA